MARSSKPCDGCGENPREPGSGRRYCASCSIGCADHGAFKTGCKACQKTRRDKPENKKIQSRRQRKIRYGLTDEELDQLEAVEVCEICGSVDKLCIDHSHETGAIRGILCDLCNRALGYARDNTKILRDLAACLEERNP